jgi:hypothetical protein
MAPFAEVEASFWDREGDTPPPVTPGEVTDTERVLGVTLPESLLRLLRLQNGGVVAEAWDACPAPPNSWAGDHVPFDHVAGAGPPGGDITLSDTPYLVTEWGLPSPVVLLSGDGHYWIALDYRACGPAGEPPVVWLDVEAGQDLRIAPDFHTFVERLTAADTFPD